MSNPGARPVVYPNGTSAVPQLLIEWEPWSRVFARNLRDALLPRREEALAVTSRPGRFWGDVFVSDQLPKRTLTASSIYHVAFAALLYALPAFLVFFAPRPKLKKAFDHQTITYYDVSEYLPPVNTGSAPARVAKKGKPAYAPQVIISTPANPDNFKQTIVDPVHPVELPVNAKLPNLVIWTEKPAPPVAAAGGHPRLTLPVMPEQVVAPAPDATPRKAEMNLPKLPQAAVVEPPPPDAARRNVAELNIGHLDPTVDSPKVVLPEQRAGGIDSASRVSALMKAATAATVAPPIPSAPGASSSAGSGMQASGKLIALGLEPAAVSGPINAPGGNRRGEFAAGPTGTPGAPGTPDIAGGGNGNGGTGTGTTGGAGRGNGGGIPSGVYVGAGPGPAPGAAVVAAAPMPAPPNNGSPSTGQGSSGAGGTRQMLMAAMSRPKLSDMHRDDSPASSAPSRANSGKIEDTVFGGKKYYQMTLNMPNLTSAGGSWIIRFAELNDNPTKGDLTAPIATVKVDPAYPADLIRDRVEGVVTLYAVIHSDGTVGDVRVLRGADERLDEYAREALARWHFRPATKNGMPVDLEAVVQIPFAAKKIPW